MGPIQPHIQWVWSTISPVVKQHGRDDNQSPSSCVEVKNGRAPLPTRLHGVVLN
jgi:hypothetical protein